MGLLARPAGSQHTQKLQHCPAMLTAVLALATLAACQTPDPQENPTWFIPSTEKPSGVDDQSFCQGQMDSPDTEFYQTRTSEILLPESLPPAICIIFPSQADLVRDTDRLPGFQRRHQAAHHPAGGDWR